MSSRRPDRNVQDDGRPSPEALLKRYHLQDSDRDPTSSNASTLTTPLTATNVKQRGRLRVYLGAAAGVGKTYAMLQEGQRRKERGTDVVIGYVETHKREHTIEQLGDLEIIPRKQIAYRGVTLEEMDTDAIIARHPQLVLVDELAHSNVAGSGHAKRYQDVMDILNAGIDVVTTLNVQHLESLNDVVASITGVVVRETLPDHILDQADEVELIDIAPYALRQRMRHGNIYPPERIEPALSNFFREGNLTALRELSLRLTANKTEAQLQRYMTEHAISSVWSTTERVLVGFDHRPQSRSIIRHAWNLAHALHADFIAVSIELTGYSAFIRRLVALFRYGSHIREMQAERSRLLKEHALFAEDLGAEVIYLNSRDIAATLAEVAHVRGITQIVLGQPAHSRWEVMLYGSVTNRILRLSSDADIHLVPLRKKIKELPLT